MLSQLYLFRDSLSSPARFLLDLLAGFFLVYVLRTITTRVNQARFIRNSSASHVVHLSDLPNPKSPSWLWGNEWEMYITSPGQKYMEWYHTFGRIFKFKGALGVSVNISSYVRMLDPDLFLFQHC